MVIKYVTTEDKTSVGRSELKVCVGVVSWFSSTYFKLEKDFPVASCEYPCGMLKWIRS